MAQALPDNRNTQFPYDPVSQPSHKRGNPDDSARYLLAPGVDFFRPWLTIPGGVAFVWPGGVEGFTCRIDPTLGIHKYIGDNAVVVDVTHKGQETITLAGTFPGLTSVYAFLALRDMIYQDIPDNGYILYVPHLYPKTQRVFVQGATFDHPEDSRLRDLHYTIDFIRTNVGGTQPEPNLRTPTPQPGPTTNSRGQAPRVFTVNATTNTLRKIARAKLGDATRWDELYRKNEKFFVKRKIAMHAVPDYRLPTGTKINY
jgi:hypothetical protein